MKQKEFEEYLPELQTELCRLQEWIVPEGLRVVIVSEGPDAGAKDGLIKDIMIGAVRKIHTHRL